MSADIEEFILKEVVSNEDYARSVLPYVKGEYFTSDVSRLVYQQVKKHFDDYNTLPTKQALTIDVTNNAMLFEKQFEKAADIVDEMYDTNHQNSNIDWAVNRTEEWCKARAMYNAILDSAAIIDPNNKDKNKKPFGAIEGMVRDALSVSFDNSVGHDYYTDTDARYEFYHSKKTQVPFGMDCFNEITGGGLPNKTLNIVLAGVHVGKSMFMCDYAANVLRQGKKVLYITCEMAEEKIAERIDANLMDVEMQDVKTLSKAEYKNRVGKIHSAHGLKGGLKIKEYPTGTANASHFRALLNELSLKQNFTPDVIVIDYLNICASMRFNGDASNSYGYMKTVAEELRGLAIEFNLPILTACQVNRGSFKDTDFDMDGIAESFGISATADFMFGMITNDVLKKHNVVCIKQLKNRYNDAGAMQRFVISVNRPKMKFTDADPAAQALISTGIAGAGVTPGPMPGGGAPPPTSPFGGSSSKPGRTGPLKI